MSKIPFELTIHLPAKGLDEGSDADLFFSFCHYTSHEHPIIIAIVCHFNSMWYNKIGVSFPLPVKYVH